MTGQLRYGTGATLESGKTLEWTAPFSGLTRVGSTPGTVAADATTVTVTRSVTAGNGLILLVAAHGASAVTVGTVADTASNTWVQAPGIAGINGSTSGDMWYVASALTTASITVTVTWAAAASATGAALLIEVWGQDNVNFLDVAHSTAASTASANSGATGKLARDNEFLVGAVCGNGNNTFTVPSFTNGGTPTVTEALANSNVSGHKCQVAAFDMVGGAAGSTETFSATDSSNTNSLTIAAAFRSATPPWIFEPQRTRNFYPSVPYGRMYAWVPPPSFRVSTAQSLFQSLTATLNANVGVTRATTRALPATLNANAITPLRSAIRALAATATGNAVISRVFQPKNLTATLTTNASAARATIRALAATFNGNGLTPLRATTRAVAATLTENAALVRSLVKVLSATLTESATTARAAVRATTATLTANAITARATVRALAATATANALLISGRLTSKTLTATMTANAAIQRAIAKKLAATFTGNAALGGRSIGRALAATLTASASVPARALSYVLAATATVSGAIGRVLPAKSFAGTMLFNGGVGRAIGRALRATLSFTGLVSSQSVYVPGICKVQVAKASFCDITVTRT